MVLLEKLLERVTKTFGDIHRSEAITKNGAEGYLIWDYMSFNELTFVDAQTGAHTSLFTSSSDADTKRRFEEYARKYSNKRETMDSLRQLKELLDLGAITAQEFHTKKKLLRERM